jgi:hypothetical protein
MKKAVFDLGVSDVYVWYAFGKCLWSYGVLGLLCFISRASFISICAFVALYPRNSEIIIDQPHRIVSFGPCDSQCDIDVGFPRHDKGISGTSILLSCYGWRAYETTPFQLLDARLLHVNIWLLTKAYILYCPCSDIIVIPLQSKCEVQSGSTMGIAHSGHSQRNGADVTNPCV